MSSLNLMPKQQKMLTFLQNLHRKYPVLDKLAQKQYQLFQSEVVMLLVDQNQNVDQRTYKQVIDTIGLDAFVLDILAKSINRNAITNQHQIKKNMNEIASGLEDKAKELQKKIKVVDRKESQINNKQASLKNRIKEYVLQQQKQILNRLANKQNQMKKNVNAFLNSLKLKEKILIEKKQQIAQKLALMCQKQRAINIKQQELNKKSVSVESNLASNNVDRSDIVIKNPTNEIIRNKQLKEINKKYDQCKDELEKLKKKYKTTEMAYSKVKADLLNSDKDKEKLKEKISQLQAQRDKLKVSKQQQHHQASNDKNNLIQQKFVIQKQTGLIDMLEMLQISQIGTEQQIEKQKIKQISLKNSKAQKSLRQPISQNRGPSKIGQFIKQKRKEPKQQSDQNQFRIQNNTKPKQCKSCHQIQQSSDSNQMPEQQEQIHHKIVQPACSQLTQSLIYQNTDSKDSCIPKFLQQSDNEQVQCSRSPTQLLQSIHSLCSPQSSQCISLLQSGLLLKFAMLPSFQLTASILSQYLDLLLLLIQQSNPKYYQIIQYLAQQQFVQFLQNAYLNHQSQLQITQSATLLLSRIMMSTTADLKFRKEFINAVTLRLKISTNCNAQNDQEEFLKANINCLLSMIHV